MKRLPVEEQSKKVVKRIVEGRYDIEVFNELYIANDQVKRDIYSYEELEGYAPLFCEYNLNELKRLLKLISTELQEEIRDKSNTYLKNLRIVEALNALGDFEKIKKVNNKIKFTLEFWFLSCDYCDPKTKFMRIALLDRA